MSLIKDVTFDEVMSAIEDKGIDTTGFDTEELMVAAFLVGAAGTLNTMLEVCENIVEVAGEMEKDLKEKYDSNHD